MIKSNAFTLPYDRVLLVISATIVFYLLLPPLTSSYGWLFIHLSDDPSIFYSQIAAGQIFALHMLTKHSNLHLFQKLGLFTFGGLSGLLVTAYMLFVSHTETALAHMAVTAPWYFATASACIALISAKEYLLEDSPTPPPKPSDQSELKRWLASQENYPLNLVGGREHQAKLISERFKDGTYQRGIVIFGEYGEGKTTLINEIKPLLPLKGWSIVHFSAWGKKQLVELVLKEIVTKLSKRFEVHQVQKLPSNILKELGKSIPSNLVIDRLISSLQPTHSNISLLQTLNNLLSFHDQKCLVIIEDIDRGSNAEKNLDELSALFDLLTKFDRIKFVFTLSDKPDYHVPLTKILDHKEALKPLDTHTALLTFGDLCRAEARDKGTIIADSKWKSPDAIQTEQINNNSYTNAAYDKLTQALSNPRMLTQTLKSAWALWGQVEGEVTILDVMIFSAIYNGDHGIKDKELLEDWHKISRKKEHTNSSVDSILLKEMNGDDSLKALAKMLIEGNGAIYSYQGISLNKKRDSINHLKLLSHASAGVKTIVSQSRLKLLEHIWSGVSQFSPETMERLINESEELNQCYLAYKTTQNIEPAYQNHLNVLIAVLNSISKSTQKRQSRSDTSLNVETTPLVNYIGWFLFEDRSEPSNWLSHLNEISTENEHTGWILLLSYYNLHCVKFEPPTTPKNKALLEKYIKSLINNLDTEYLLSLENNQKWEILAKYNPNWSVIDALETIHKKGSVNFIAQSIKLLSKILSVDPFEGKLESFLQKIHGFTNKDSEVFVSHLTTSIKQLESQEDPSKRIKSAIEDLNHENTYIEPLSQKVVIFRLKSFLGLDDNSPCSNAS